jgi:hypothetical protein
LTRTIEVQRRERRWARRYPAIQTIVTLALGLLALLGLAACGGESSTTGGNEGAQGTPAQGAAGGDLQISLITDPSPPKSGPATIAVEIKDAAGKPVDGAQVSISANHVGMSHGGIEGELTPAGSGRYEAKGSFSMSGTWRAEVQVTPQGGTAKTRSFDLQVER